MKNNFPGSITKTFPHTIERQLWPIKLHERLTLDRSTCDQIGRFFKFTVTNFPTKVAQMFGGFWGYF